MSERDEGKYISRQEKFRQQVTQGELSVVRDLIVALDEKKYDGLRGVHWVMFLAGDFADSFDNVTISPEHIDLRLVLDAPSGSRIQNDSVHKIEAAVNDFLETSGLEYMAKTGDDWHMGRASFDPDCHEYIKIKDDLPRHNDIRFTIEPNEQENVRRIDVVINRIEGRGIEDQMRWETEIRRRQPVILFDSLFPKSCIL